MDAKESIYEDIAALRNVAASGDAKPPHVYDKLADNALVRHATAAMREKLALARSRGRGGWWNNKECSIDLLRRLLREHVEKGDMRDVMNLAAMVYVREIADMPPNAELSGGGTQSACESCEWTPDEFGAWDTQCGHRFEVTDGTPHENKMAFCPYCGKALMQCAPSNALAQPTPERRSRGGDFNPVRG